MSNNYNDQTSAVSGTGGIKRKHIEESFLLSNDNDETPSVSVLDMSQQMANSDRILNSSDQRLDKTSRPVSRPINGLLNTASEIINDGD